jgi:cytochrome P450
VFVGVRLIALASTDTVQRATANLFVGLLQSPGQLDALRRDGSLVNAAIDEAVRWECPATGVPRRAIAPIELAGARIPPGAFVYISLAAANRDPARWKRPDDFDIGRERRPHVGFGGGVHACVGAPLARAAIGVLVERLLHRFAHLRLDPEAARPRIEGTFLRSARRLDVLLDDPAVRPASR